MNKSNRIHARIQEFFQARGGGGGGRGPTARKQSGQCFFSHQLISTYFTVYRVDPMVLLQRGGGVQLLPGGGGTQRRLNGIKLSPAGRDSKCGSREGSGPLENHKLCGFL